MPEKNRILIPHTAFSDEDNSQELTLSADELYLYAWLYRRRVPYEWDVETTIDTIHALCINFFKGNDSRNKKYIRDLLLKLNQKKYLDVYSEIGFGEKTKYTEPLHIVFSKVRNGYNTKTTYQTFDMFQDPLEFYIYAYIDHFESAGKAISYSKWVRILKKSDTTIKKIINKMNCNDFEPRIWKFSGNYFETRENVRQQQNIYYTRPSDEVKEKWNRLYGNKIKKNRKNKGKNIPF